MNDKSVADVAREYPEATRVFERYGIDYCCGGDKKLEQACQEKELDMVAVIEDINQSVKASERGRRWDEAPLGEVIAHLLHDYHRPLDSELARLDALASKVFDVHGDKAGNTLGDVLAVYRALKAELEDHMAKEEEVLFPMILQGNGAMAGPPISVMHQEHEDAAAALRRLRELTEDFQAPADACPSWRALWHGLHALEMSLHEHIHLENNILFPRALAIDPGILGLA